MSGCLDIDHYLDVGTVGGGGEPRGVVFRRSVTLVPGVVVAGLAGTLVLVVWRPDVWVGRPPLWGGG